MKLSEIHIRDPFILASRSRGEYYLYASTPKEYGKGFCAYKSVDLENWTGPYVVFDATDFWAKDSFWAPEVHFYKGRFYLFGTFGTNGVARTSQILVADSPLGPFEVLSGAIAPPSWFALDATLYLHKGTPYAIFSHEWVQTPDGEMCAVALADDLSSPTGETKILFKASESGWAKSPKWNTEKYPVYVVDAPFVYSIDGFEFLLWSSWSSSVDSDTYSIGAVYPESGNILSGKYRHELLELPQKDCGHAMIFKDFEGRDRICYHKNNSLCGRERAVINYIKIENERVKVYEKI